MAAVRVKPTKPDVVIARTVSRNTNHRTEMVSRGLTGRRRENPSGARDRRLVCDAW